ncbi:MAG: hypothetical protein WA133_12735 [Syntrophales bacterium]
MGIKLCKCLLLLFLVSLFGVGNSWAVEIRGRSSTQFLWFDDFYNGRQTELTQYLRVAATGIDAAGKFSLYGYGRAGATLQNGDDIYNDDRTNGRLYYLYGDYRDIGGKVDIKVGRQFANLSADSSIIDGASFDVKNVGPVGFTFLGGRNVIFGLNGEMGHTGDYAAGVAMYLQGFQTTDLDISWFRKWDQYDVARDMLGASFKQYLFNTVKLYGNARYDMVSEVFNDLLGGIKVFPLANLSLTGEYYQNYPTFDTTSIYSVFAVNRYKEIVARADYTLNENLAVNAGYTRQDFGDDGSRGDVYILGCTLRPLATLTIDLNYDRRSGYGGDLNGGAVDVAYDATKDLRLAAGLAYDVYQRDNMTGEETAKNGWLGAKYKLNNSMSASLRVEDSVNKSDENNWQGRFVFDYDF